MVTNPITLEILPSVSKKDLKEAVIIIVVVVFDAPGLSCGMQTLSWGMWALVPWPRIEARSLHWEFRVLTTRPPEKSPKAVFSHPVLNVSFALKRDYESIFFKCQVSHFYHYHRKNSANFEQASFCNRVSNYFIFMRPFGTLNTVCKTLEKGMATHSSILAWRIPWTEKPDRRQSTETQRLHMAAHSHIHYGYSP